MQLENPKEYLSLVRGEEDNFSEVYGVRYELGWGLSGHFHGPSGEVGASEFRVRLE